MNYSTNKLDWRFAVVLIFIIIAILYGLFLLLIPRQNPTPQTQPNTPSSKGITPTNALSIVLSPTINQTQLNEWKNYKTDLYTIKYPPDWKPEAYPFEGGLSIITRPEYLAEGYYVPSLSISQKRIIKPLEEEIRFYDKLEFTQSSEIIDQKKAIKLSGVVPVRVEKRVNIAKPVYENHYFLEHNGYLFSIKYHYDGSKRDQNSEELFNKIIQTFKILP